MEASEGKEVNEGENVQGSAFYPLTHNHQDNIPVNATLSLKEASDVGTRVSKLPYFPVHSNPEYVLAECLMCRGAVRDTGAAMKTLPGILCPLCRSVTRSGTIT